MHPIKAIQNQVFSILLTVVLVGVIICGHVDEAIAASPPPYEPMVGPKEEMGAWSLIPLPPAEDQMQAVHTILLPNQKVLIANGSSNRSRLENGQVLIGVDGKKPEVVDNTTLFDPALSDPDRALVSGLEPDYISNPFERIASPPTPVNGETNDIFCSGHLHLPNGNVLFAGGNRRYYPNGGFQGTKHTNIFDWRTNRWSSAGEMVNGRWYPTLVSLDNGKIAIFSGIGFGNFETNSIVEFYDPQAANDKAWQAIDLKDVENSPFNTPMVNTATEPWLLRRLLNRPSLIPDVLDLYPRIFPTADGQYLITGDGGGKAPLALPNSTNTYLMSIDEDETGKISIRFADKQPQRKERNKGYGTAVADPNSNDILLIGGIVGTNDIQFGNPNNPNNRTFQQAGAFISSSLERWRAPSPYGDGDTPNGSWEIEKDFLGRPWAMGQAVILPTKEILVMEGGRYGEVDAYKDPLLLHPDPSAPESYTKQTMNPAQIPRLYHNNALLLADGRVLSIGGNTNQAVRDEVSGTVYTNTESDPNGFIRFVYPPYPEYYVPAEIWQAEIFSPPYLFRPGPRPEISQAPEHLNYGESAAIAVNHVTAEKYSMTEAQTHIAADSSLVLIKLSSNTHDFDSGQRLADLPLTTIELSDEPDTLTATLGFTAPDNPHLYPPGYYMLFYLNEVGKPSHAKMIQLGQPA